MVPFYECQKMYKPDDVFYVEMWDKTVRVIATFRDAVGLRLGKGQDVIGGNNRTYLVEVVG